MVVADLSRKMKIFRGTALSEEHALLDDPVALVVYYADSKAPKAPCIAVASGPYVFMYRNLRPYYKFTLPLVDLDVREREVWDRLAAGVSDASAAADELSLARDSGVLLCSRSLDFLAIDDSHEREQFVSANKSLPLRQQTVITCMERLCKSEEGETALSCLVIGTEDQSVLVLNPAGSHIVVRVKLPAVPALLTPTGLFDVEYRVFVACRNGSVHCVKNGELTSTVIELETQIAGIVWIDNSIVVATVEGAIHSFHVKGKKQYSIYLAESIVCVEVLNPSRASTLSAVAVALSTGEVRVYCEKALVSTFTLEEPVTAMRFGSYGREDNTLMSVTKSGALDVRILRRGSRFDRTSAAGAGTETNTEELQIPKKTRLYVEQTQRERDHAVEMHRVFQRDLCKLRLSTARTYVKVITLGHGPIAFSGSNSLKLNVFVQGLSPGFKMLLSLQNTGTRQLTNLTVTFAYNPEVHRIRRPLFAVPLVIPSLQYKFETQVTCVHRDGGSDDVKVLVCDSRSCVPLISAVVTMPTSEPQDA